MPLQHYDERGQIFTECDTAEQQRKIKTGSLARPAKHTFWRPNLLYPRIGVVRLQRVGDFPLRQRIVDGLGYLPAAVRLRKRILSRNCDTETKGHLDVNVVSELLICVAGDDPRHVGSPTRRLQRLREWG